MPDRPAAQRSGQVPPSAEAGAPTTEPTPSFIPRDTDEKPSDAMPSAGFADWREQAEWWERTCNYWREQYLAAAGVSS
jgi:hypothetical protein